MAAMRYLLVAALLFVAVGCGGQAAEQQPETPSYEITKRGTLDLGKDGSRDTIEVSTDVELNAENVEAIGKDMIDKECKPEQEEPYWLLVNNEESAFLHCDREEVVR